MKSDEQYSAEETQQRLAAIMRGAKHSPQPLKDIPKKRGGSRSGAKKKVAQKP